MDLTPNGHVTLSTPNSRSGFKSTRATFDAASAVMRFDPFKAADYVLTARLWSKCLKYGHRENRHQIAGRNETTFYGAIWPIRWMHFRAESGYWWRDCWAAFGAVIQVWCVARADEFGCRGEAS